MTRLIPFLIALCAISLQAQTLVSPYPEKKSVVLEEFTGINCGWCPGGHEAANELREKYGERFNIVNVHCGPYAVPGAGQPNFATAEGEELMYAQGAPDVGFPSGSLNREAAIGRIDWDSRTEALMQENSPINVGLQSEYDDLSGQFTIQTEVFATSEFTEASLVVAVLESFVSGPQVDNALNTTHEFYSHNHMLKNFLTGWEGEVIEDLTVNSLAQNSFTYSVTAEENPNAISIVAYVIVDGAIVSARTIDAQGGTTLATAHVTTSDPEYLEMPMNTTASNSFSFTNLLVEDESYKIEWDETAPFDWNIVARVNDVVVEEGGTFSVAAGETVDLRLGISSHVTPALALLTAKISSVTYPEAPAFQHNMFVVSGVRDLVVSNPLFAAPRGQYYLAGLQHADNEAHAETDIFTYNRFMKAGSLSEVKNVYLNISWTFPALLDETVGYLKNFMDNGGNLLIAGQDIGWDQYSGHQAAWGTDITRDFYDNYMHASYIDDGNSSNNLIVPLPDDEIFGSLGGSNLQDVDDGNLYPESIAAINGGIGFIEYGNLFNGQIQTGAIRAETENYKMVYLGFGLEQIANPDVANDLMKMTHDWFYEGIEISDPLSIDEKEFSLSIAQNYPNPASELTQFSMAVLEEEASLQFFDLDGKVILRKSVDAGESTVTVNVSKLPAGIYYYRLLSESGGQSPSLKMVVE